MGFSFFREVGLGVGLVGRGMETVRSSIIDSFFHISMGSVCVGNARGFTDADVIGCTKGVATLT